MVAPRQRTEKPAAVRAHGVPVIDLADRSRPGLSRAVVRACEEWGIFKVVNHGVPAGVVRRLEEDGSRFFARPVWEKEQAGPGKPFGYGCKNIGFNGDMGELEYLLLHTRPSSAQGFLLHPHDFGAAVDDYVHWVRELACDLLDLVAEGLWAPDKGVLSRLIRDVESDSLLRLNHYPPSSRAASSDGHKRVDFGEHTDPQILTLLRSNGVGGLQICTRDGHWLAVPPDPDAFFVMVGDALQVMTNGRFESIKHRVVEGMGKRRMSFMYFGAPPLDARISPLRQLGGGGDCDKYKSFTWSEYKRAAYASRLGDCRLNHFKIQNN